MMKVEFSHRAQLGVELKFKRFIRIFHNFSQKLNVYLSNDAAFHVGQADKISEGISLLSDLSRFFDIFETGNVGKVVKHKKVKFPTKICEMRDEMQLK